MPNLLDHLLACMMLVDAQHGLKHLMEVTYNRIFLYFLY